MPPLPFRIVNVFATTTTTLLSGNALCVFEDASSLRDDQMFALARQLNLAETSFLVPSERASAKVRIFTPTGEMPFAGHPTLGTAHVFRELHGAGDALTLEMQAGVIPVTANGDAWTFRANPPRARSTQGVRMDIETALGLQDGDLASEPIWIDTGVEQLIVPLASADAVYECAPSAERVTRWAASAEKGIYAWAPKGDGEIVARFFYVERGALFEDPGSGSACANLGGWFILRRGGGARELTITQGEQTGRTCRLGLRVSAEKEIFVTGSVISIGKGEMAI
jgi:trans-2,3-dihydro-3-hydroxyanthranilate isomerase